MPMYHDMYYCINMASSPFVLSHVWYGDTIDYDYYKENNCFKTPEEAEAKLKQIKKLRKTSSLFVSNEFCTELKKTIDNLGLGNLLEVEVQPNGEGDKTYPEPYAR